MSNANPPIIAKLFEKAPSEPEPEELVQKRNKIYRTLYGLPDGTNKITDQDLLKQGAKPIYFTVTAYDKAKEYKDTASHSGSWLGNATVSFYRGTKELLNLINGNMEGYSSFSVKDIQESSVAAR